MHLHRDSSVSCGFRNKSILKKILDALEAKLSPRPTMARRLLPVLLVTTCYLQANGFSPSGIVSERLDIKVISEAVPTVEDSSCATEENLPGLSLPPVIQQIADERREFQMNLGKAMDTLRKDMPDILKRAPGKSILCFLFYRISATSHFSYPLDSFVFSDYSIYHDEISAIDPSGVQLTGIESYKSSIKFLQTFVKFWFQERSGLQYRMVYDFARSSIRISWHAVLVPKVPLGRPLHVDGISMYKLDPSSGKIIEHKIENLMINNTPVVPPYGIFSMMQQDLLGLSGQPGAGVPAGAGV
jgi:hypothetical protein